MMPQSPFIDFWRALTQFCRLTRQPAPTYGDAAAIWETRTGRKAGTETSE